MRIIFTLGAFLTIGYAFAQKSELEFLIRPALSSTRGNSAGQLDPTLKITGGVGMNFFLKNGSIINAMILYDRKGESKETVIRYANSPSTGTTEERIILKNNYNYITVPVQWGKRFGTKVKYQFGVGFYTSILLKQESEVIRLDSSPDYTVDNTNMFKRLDLGLSGSFSLYFPLSDKLSIKIALDDNFGLLNVSSVPISGDGSIMHNSVGLQTGINVKLN